MNYCSPQALRSQAGRCCARSRPELKPWVDPVRPSALRSSRTYSHSSLFSPAIRFRTNLHHESRPDPAPRERTLLSRRTSLHAFSPSCSRSRFSHHTIHHSPTLMFALVRAKAFLGPWTFTNTHPAPDLLPDSVVSRTPACSVCAIDVPSSDVAFLRPCYSCSCFV